MKNQLNTEKREITFLDVAWILITPLVWLFALLLKLFGLLPASTQANKEGTANIFWRTGDIQEHYIVRLNSDQQGDLPIMQTVKATQGLTAFSIVIASAADSEGNPIPTSDFSLSTPESDNLTAVVIESWDSETRQGTMSFGRTNEDGSPNHANLTVNVLNPDGTVAAPLGEQIAVVHGDVASFEGGFVLSLNNPIDPPTEEPTPEDGSEVDTAPIDEDDNTGVPAAALEESSEDLELLGATDDEVEAEDDSPEAATEFDTARPED